MSRRERRRTKVRKQVNSTVTPCVVCGKGIPQNHVAIYYMDRWAGKIYGAHMACADGRPKVFYPALKKAMTTPEWLRFQCRRYFMDGRRALKRYAARWTTSPKVTR